MVTIVETVDEGSFTYVHIYASRTHPNFLLAVSTLMPLTFRLLFVSTTQCDAAVAVILHFAFEFSKKQNQRRFKLDINL